MSWINPEPIAPVAPILVYGEVQDGYLQQRRAEDLINIEVTEPRLPKKEPSSTSIGILVLQRMQKIGSISWNLIVKDKHK